jgi:hypothetical protein
VEQQRLLARKQVRKQVGQPGVVLLEEVVEAHAALPILR